MTALGGRVNGPASLVVLRANKIDNSFNAFESFNMSVCHGSHPASVFDKVLRLFVESIEEVDNVHAIKEDTCVASKWKS